MKKQGSILFNRITLQYQKIQFLIYRSHELHFRYEHKNKIIYKYI